MSLSQEEFQHICETIGGQRSTVDKATLYSAVCCAGKSVIRSHLDDLWPADKSGVDHEQAYQIFDRLEDLVVDGDDMERIRRQGLQIDCEKLLELLFVQAVEQTKHETLSRLLELQESEEFI
ncbi:hypothetical protein GCK32_015746, partial [Trichostrongylus colubriformis]